MIMKHSILLALALVVASCCGGGVEQKTASETVQEVILSRRSIRKYKAVPVSRDTMEVILQAGINAPNGMNKQCWEIRVVDNPQLIEQIKQAMEAANPDANNVGACFRGAPVLAFIANSSYYDLSAVDCGLLAENMILNLTLASPIG